MAQPHSQLGWGQLPEPLHTVEAHRAPLRVALLSRHKDWPGQLRRHVGKRRDILGFVPHAPCRDDIGLFGARWEAAQAAAIVNRWRCRKGAIVRAQRCEHGFRWRSHQICSVQPAPDFQPILLPYCGWGNPFDRGKPRKYTGMAHHECG